MVIKTVLITGANRGIGLSLAGWYTEQGWNVIGAAGDPANATKLKVLKPYKLVQLDVSDDTSITNAAKELDGVTIDLLINNAGVCESDMIESVTREVFMRHFETNALGPFFVTRALLPNLKHAASANGSARVAQITSLAGSIKVVGSGAIKEKVVTSNISYFTSKAALNMVNANLSLELKEHNIAVILLNPGFVATDMAKGVDARLQPDECASALGKIIDGVTLANTGKFYDVGGEELPW
ncbi:hypothetical protein JG688_00013758 [Phytophthora aleatoria]|uniref:Short chain dehydrogenase n=1 Tax=Phytophthora aleatoria TaxID=2496075 RepID=A0A8J5J1B8_9STRA|nr:hypothetical protein JG688_00013758 [Phytophthora aleatoria]